MVDFLFKKHPQAFEEGLMMGLLYFDDADEDKDPILLKPRKWTDIKKRIEKEVYKSFRIRR